ncbi:MAG: hypothetical protein NT069_32000 [Planctomycetota bacterium]|nr:hypothetical protein [Planctomycetota bacterium]
MRKSNESRLLWICFGLFVGVAMAWMWPHEPAFATNSDRDQDFAIFTVTVGNQAAGIADPIDGVFILDFLTGQLRGAVLNRATGQFTSFYLIDLTKEFGITGGGKPKYAVATGNGQLNNQGGVNLASGVIYIAEATTGKCLAYTFPWQDGNVRPTAPLPLKRIHFFQWKAPKE